MVLFCCSNVLRVNDGRFDVRRALRGHADYASSRLGKTDDAPGDVRSAIIESYID
jgi:hypothetical protein